VATDIINNQTFLMAIVAWAIAQILKVLVNLVQERRIIWKFFFTSGGMPSSHTSTVCALATGIALTTGVGSVAFSIAFVLAVIVMYDAAGVRQSVGQHSIFLNRIVKEFKFKASKTEMEKDFREFIGHTRLQVFMGAVVGILVAWVWVTISGI